jgi:hypothetical protein
MLHKIKTGGIEAYCSDLIIDKETNNSVYFLSIAGYQTTVKGILANFVKGEPLSIKINNNIHWVEKLPGNYHMKLKKMPSAYSHGIALPKIGQSQENEQQTSTREFLLISNKHNDVKNLFFGQLDQRAEIPLHQSWTEWLWKLFEEKEWVTKLKTLIGQFEGYLVSIHQEEMSDEITQAIRKKVPEVIQCMKRR